MLEAVIRAGATTFNIPERLVIQLRGVRGVNSGIKENVPNIDGVVISVHCHNDLGMASANSLAQ
ncbi:MAG: hypothetical protein CM1200mP39_15780 [Dehalococcoidia bacterium]|nr:MAG: hypothetical protein CM1200mP39_15780 [Dehalococcoidia bacterium]